MRSTGSGFALSGLLAVCVALGACSQPTPSQTQSQAQTQNRSQAQNQTQTQTPASPPLATFKITTARFTLTDPATATSGQDGSTVPGLWIDTHIRISGMFGGTIKSHLPYDIAFNLTNTAGTLKRVDVTAISITYDDGTPEPAAKAITLPIGASARQIESVNSVAGGRVVRTKLWHIGGRIPEVITRNESFGLTLKGHVTKRDGTALPFVIEQHYDVQLENTTKPAVEVFKDV